METNQAGIEIQGPKSIGVIIDGNRRWAKEHGLTTYEGHRAGLEKIKDIMLWAEEAQVSEVTIYAFSTENWNRKKEEVEDYMKLVSFAFDTWIEEVIEKDIKICIIGERHRFSEDIQKRFNATELRTKNGKKGTLILALSYGGRAEILAATNALLTKGKKEVTQEEFRKAMWSADFLDPDLIIRTGGEKRLSNFLTWQSVYSELYFTDTKWPAFSKEEFDSILADFASRERRHGK